MRKLTFKDGESFDLSGPLRLEERYDGWYVLGNNKMIPVSSWNEGNKLINDQLPQDLKISKSQETRVYLINLNGDTSDIGIGDWNNVSDEVWMNLSEENGTVYSLEGFQRAFNNEEIPYDTYLRFITIKIKTNGI